MGPVVKAEVSGDLSSSPAKPADEEMVRNIEVLCRFIVNVGPDFENLARNKEVGNPQFAFLFGGEPGSHAAIGYEYFQWMKRKCLSEKNSLTNQERSVPHSRALETWNSSQCIDHEEGAVVSPSVSDMDMEGKLHFSLWVISSEIFIESYIATVV